MTEFSEQWAYRFQSIVDELCSNAIEHGSKQGDLIKITFQNVPHQYLQIFVEDSGNADKHLNASQITKLVNERKTKNQLNGLIRGRGLPKIVSEWTDELEFQDTENGGIKVRVKKLLQNLNDQSSMPEKLEKPTHIMLN